MISKTMCELFAGVGGFRVGMERLGSGWNTVWFSQWEPHRKVQWAHDCYVYHFGDTLDMNGKRKTNKDISLIDKSVIPDHTLLVGGFPCQPFSTAATGAKGLDDKEKGILWWQIRDTIEAKRPMFCIFENVDRLLKSPAKQRGRDFGVMLTSLANLGYWVEWRVVNAASYGAPQRRRRTFIFACRNDVESEKFISGDVFDIILERGFMQRAFPAIKAIGVDDLSTIELPHDMNDVYSNFEFSFENAGYMKDYKVSTIKVESVEESPVKLKDILERNVDDSFYIPDDKLPDWKYLKGAKKMMRTAKTGYEYIYSEGAVAFPDSLDKPARTMLTSETKLNRSSHVVADLDTNRLRVLTPVETERLQCFDDNWTKHTTSGDMPLNMRYFCMGNALVTSMVTRMGKVLDDFIDILDK